MLRYSYENENEIPDEHKALYKANSAGRWVLQIEGNAVVPKERLDEFRETNRGLQKKVTEFEEKFSDIDLDKYTELLAIEDDLKKKKLPKDFDLETELGKRTDAMKKAHEKEIKAARDSNEKLTGTLATLQISEAAVLKATEHGLRPGAAEDLKARAERKFTLKDGKVVALDKDGEVLRNDTAEPYSMADFVAETLASAPHLFEASKGGGSEGGKGGPKIAGHTGPNPYAEGSVNMTQQAILERTNPELAKRLEAAAGAAKGAAK